MFNIIHIGLKIKNYYQNLKKLILKIKSFTLAELLIAIAIVAVLSVAVLLVLNPIEYLKQSRDSRRMENLTKLNKTLSWFEADTGGREFMGTSSIVYVSIPDTTSTCANLGLPALPSGWSYNCVTSSTLQKTDGTGWIPINFNQLSFGKTLPKLPIDPINTTSSGQYYTYVTGGSFEITAMFESEKYKKIYLYDNDDGGDSDSLIEFGSNLFLNPIKDKNSLVGYYKFIKNDENILYDYSEINNNGIITSGNGSWSNRLFYGSYIFDGNTTTITFLNDYISTNPITISFWGYFNNPNSGSIINNGSFNLYLISSARFVLTSDNNSSSVRFPVNSVKIFWTHYVLTRNTDGNAILYINSINVGYYCCGGFSGNPQSGITNLTIGKFNGAISDLKIYNRILSDAEIKAIYNATK